MLTKNPIVFYCNKFIINKLKQVDWKKIQLELKAFKIKALKLTRRLTPGVTIDIKKLE